MKIKAISLFLAFCMAAFVLCGCRITQTILERGDATAIAAEVSRTDEAATIATDIRTQADQTQADQTETETEQVTAEPTEAEQTTAEPTEAEQTTAEPTEAEQTTAEPIETPIETIEDVRQNPYIKYENGSFVPQGSSSVEVGDYPKTPTDVIIQYLALNCLIQDYYSEQITERIYELAGYARWDIYGSPGSWSGALYAYQTGAKLPGGLVMTAKEEDFGEMATVTVTMQNPQKPEEVKMGFDLALGDGKWRISYAAGEISVGAGKENIHFSTYGIRETYHSNEGGYADIDLLLPEIEGSYAGIPKINEYFAGKKQFFYDEVSDMVGPPDDYSDGYFRSAYYCFAAKIGNIISISAQTDGWFGGVGWGEIEGDVFDLNTGKKLGLSDIFKVKKDQYLGYIYDFVEREVAKIIGDDPDSLYFDEGIREYYNEDNFYLTEDYLVVFYQKYEIAAGAAGPQVFYIPYNSISDMLAIAVPLG